MSFDPVMPPYNSSDPTARFLSSSCLDFLLIELVPMAYRVTNELEAVAREQELLQEGGGCGNVTGSEGTAAAGETNGSGTTGSEPGTGGVGVSKVGGAGGGARRAAETPVAMDEQEEREAVLLRLDKIGYRVGQGLVERYDPVSPFGNLCRGGQDEIECGRQRTDGLTGRRWTDSPATGHASMTHLT